jgi:hypothetical protein
MDQPTDPKEPAALPTVIEVPINFGQVWHAVFAASVVMQAVVESDVGGKELTDADFDRFVNGANAVARATLEALARRCDKQNLSGAEKPQ